MKCPACGRGPLSVLETREGAAGGNTTRRRRACGACQHRFTTIEVEVDDSTPGDPVAAVLTASQVRDLRRVLRRFSYLLPTEHAASPNSDRLCVTCGHPFSNHPYRHPFKDKP